MAGLLLGDESMGATAWAGGVLMLGASILASIGQQQQQSKEDASSSKAH